MLFPFLVATDGLDPLRPDEDAPDEDLVRDEHEDTESDVEPALSTEASDAEPPVSQPPEPVEPVALIPAAATPEPPAAPVESVRPVLREETPNEKADGEAPRSPVQRFVLAVLLVAAAGLIGYVLSRPAGLDARNPDAVARSVEAARQLQFVLDTQEPLEARRFVRNEFGWRVGVPIIPRVGLQGVAVAEVADEVEVPVFLYADADDREIAVFVYSYALLDQTLDRLTLARADLDDLALGDPVRRPVGPAETFLWRDRDDIYIAVASPDATHLIDGLTMAR